VQVKKSEEVTVKKADIGVGIGLLLLSVWVFWKSLEYRERTIYIYGPNFFPQILSILICACAIGLIVRAIQGKVLSRTDHIDKHGFIRMMMAIGICIGYLFLMQLIGFMMATCVFLFTLMAFLRQIGLIKRIISSVAVALIVWVIFRYFLIIPIPTGMFSFTF
jgi:putative tricarboxylic transport membrane protein